MEVLSWVYASAISGACNSSCDWVVSPFTVVKSNAEHLGQDLCQTIGYTVAHRPCCSLFQPFPTPKKVPVAEPTAVGAGSACWWQERAAPSVCARKSVAPPLCRCVALTGGSTRTTARFTAPPAWRGDGSMWCTAKTASLKVCLSHVPHSKKSAGHLVIDLCLFSVHTLGNKVYWDACTSCHRIWH